MFFREERAASGYTLQHRYWNQQLSSVIHTCGASGGSCSGRSAAGPGGSPTEGNRKEVGVSARQILQARQGKRGPPTCQTERPCAHLPPPSTHPILHPPPSTSLVNDCIVRGGRPPLRASSSCGSCSIVDGGKAPMEVEVGRGSNTDICQRL